MALVVERFDVFLVNLDPTIESEIRKTRPCLIISPDEINRNIRTVIIAPMTKAQRDYPTRAACVFKRKKGQIVLDQIRSIDKARLIKRIGTIDPKTQADTIVILQEMFAF